MVEDHISALLTKDPEKLKVYEQEYDGHCLRAYSYYKHLMPDVTEKLDYAKTGKCFKVTMEDGSVHYFSENDPKFKEIQNE